MTEFQPLPVVDVSENAPRAGPPAIASHARGLIRLVYTNNPFYVVSAGLVLWGLRLSFDGGAKTFEAGALMAGLAGYTLLLAAAACFLVRFGKVWDDVRTVLLLVVLMFLAISMTFDESLAANSRIGSYYFLGGLAIAIIVSEGLFWGMPLSLPALFRLPYYLILSLFFLYPLGLTPYLDLRYHPSLQWGLFGFSSVAGLIFLTLLPAVWRGRAYIRRRRPPWPWPLYPWSLFAVLAFAVCMRAYCMCMSFHPEKNPATVFGPYFLIPFLLAVNVLLMEIGVAARSRFVPRLALILPFGLLALAATGPDILTDDLGFLMRFHDTVGVSPWYLTVIGVAVFCALAMLRRVGGAIEAMTAALGLFALSTPKTIGLSTLGGPHWVPILLIGLLQLVPALRRRSSWRCLFAAGCFVGAVVLRFPGTSLLAHGPLIPAHLLLGAMLLIGATFRDGFARFLQQLGAAAILAGGIYATFGSPQHLGDLSPVLVSIYPVLIATVAVAYGWLVCNRFYYLAALGSFGCWAAIIGVQTYAQLRRSVVGLDQIAGGILFFLLAMLISLTKAGLPQRMLARWKNEC